MDVFREGKFKLLGLTEMILKGNGEASWCGVNGIVAGGQEMERARGGVAILLNDVWHSVLDVLAVEYSGLISSFQGLKFVRWWCTTPMKEIMKKGTDSGMTWIGFWID